MIEAERRRLSRERKKLAAERAPQRDAADGSISVRIGPSPLLMGGTDSGQYEWLLIPDRPLKSSEGRNPPREVVVRLRRALGLYTLIAYHNLLAIPKTVTAAKDDLGRVTTLDVKGLLREGRSRLKIDTAYRSEEQLRHQARFRIGMLKSIGAAVPQHGDSKLTAELSTVQLISHAHSRTQAILIVAEEAQRRAARTSPKSGGQRALRLVDTTSWNVIQNSFGRHFCGLSIEELYLVALYTDVNPTTLWPQHIRWFAQLFEIARFIGRIDRGVAARLEPDHLKLLDDILNDMFGPFDDVRDTLATETRAKLAIHFDEDALRRAVRHARTRSGGLVVPHKNAQERQGDWDDL